MKRAAVCFLAILFMAVPAMAQIQGDVNNDNRIDLAEAVYALRVMAGLSVGFTDLQKSELEEVNNLVVDNAQGNKGLDELAQVLDNLNLDEAQDNADKADEELSIFNGGLNFACGTVSVDSWVERRLQFVFDPESDCGIGGTVYVTVGRVDNGFTYTMQYQNVTVGSCDINGTGSMTLAMGQGAITIHHTSNDLTVCGNSFNGTATLVLDSNTGALISATVLNSITTQANGKDLEMDSDLVYTPDGGLNGATAMVLDGKTYDVTYENVLFDPLCGIPTSGVIWINGIKMDFSETTCDDPTVTVTVRGVEAELSLEDAINLALSEDPIAYMAELLGQGDDMGEGMEEIDEVLEKIDLKNARANKADDVQSAYDYLAGVQFACGTIHVDEPGDHTLRFSFDPESDCGIGGELVVSVTKPADELVFVLDYQNVTTGTCTINGTASTTIAFGEGTITTTHTSTDLSVCGNTLNGSSTVVMDSTTGEMVSATINTQAGFNADGKDITAALSMVYLPEAGSTGTANFTVDGTTYNVSFANIIIDPACGLPVAGTMTINNIQVDFTPTTCDNPVVTVTVGPVSADIPLEDAISLAKSENPVNWLLAYLGEEEQNTDSQEQLNEVLDKLGLKNAQDGGSKAEGDVPTADEVFNYLKDQANLICGTVSDFDAPTRMVEFTFAGGDGCGFTGTVTVTVTKPADAIVYEIAFDNVDTGPCTLNGSTKTTISVSNDTVTYSHESSDLTLCGHSLNGASSFTYSTNDQQLTAASVHNAVTLTLGGVSVQIIADFDYVKDAGLTGSATVQAGARSFSCTFNNLVLDPACGIPTGGTMTVNSLTLDFTGSSCGDPQVAVTIRGKEFTLPLDGSLALGLLEDPLNFALEALNKLGLSAEQQALLGLAMDKMGLAAAEKLIEGDKSGELAALLAYLASPTFDFACGTVTVDIQAQTATFNFDPEPDCGIYGQVAVMITRPGDTFIYQITYSNLNSGDCGIVGTTTGSLVFGADTVTYIHTSQGLQICVNMFDGTTTTVVDTASGAVKSVTIDTVIQYVSDGEDVWVDAMVVYDGTTGSFSGTILMKKGRKTYDIAFTDITLDPNCGIPNGGTMTVNGIGIDFTGTTCEDPTVTVTVRNRSVEMSLEDAITLISG